MFSVQATTYQDLVRALEFLATNLEIRNRNRAICDPCLPFSLVSHARSRPLTDGEITTALQACEAYRDSLRRSGIHLPVSPSVNRSPKKVLAPPSRLLEICSTPTEMPRALSETERYEEMIHALSSVPQQALVEVDLPVMPSGRSYLEHQKVGVQWFLTPRPNQIMGGILADQMGLGKAQPLDAKILTPTGWTTMGEVKTGDCVIGANGSPCKVTGVFPQGRKEVFSVTFSDNTSTECCKEHLWAVQSPYQRSKIRQVGFFLWRKSFQKD